MIDDMTQKETSLQLQKTINVKKMTEASSFVCNPVDYRFDAKSLLPQSN